MAPNNGWIAKSGTCSFFSPEVQMRTALTAFDHETQGQTIHRFHNNLHCMIHTYQCHMNGANAREECQRVMLAQLKRVLKECKADTAEQRAIATAASIEIQSLQDEATKKDKAFAETKRKRNQKKRAKKKRRWDKKRRYINIE
jgi:hypothetical protein